MDRTKLRWLRKLLLTKNFVLLTDKGSVICLKGVDPEFLLDRATLEAQKVMLEHYQEHITEMLAEHEKILQEGVM